MEITIVEKDFGSALEVELHSSIFKIAGAMKENILKVATT
jgi:hypothetical protein